MRGSFNNDPNNQMKNLATPSNANFSNFSNAAITNPASQPQQHYSMGQQQNANFPQQHMPGQNIQMPGRTGIISE